MYFFEVEIRLHFSLFLIIFNDVAHTSVSKQEVDLLLNDGSKHKNAVEWRKHTTLPQRVETSRRRSRRCLLMSLALAKTPTQKVSF